MAEQYIKFTDITKLINKLKLEMRNMRDKAHTITLAYRGGYYKGLDDLKDELKKL